MALPVERIVPDAYNLHKKLSISEACEFGFDERCLSRNDPTTGNLDFNIEGNNEHCIVPSQCYLKINVRITGQAKTTAGTTVTYKDIGSTPEPKVFLVNNALHSIFESTEVYVGHQATTKVDKHNAYIGYINTLINYGQQSLHTYHHLSGWSKDTAGEMDSLEKTLNAYNNKALTIREQMLEKGVKAYTGEFIGRICSPIFEQERIIPTQVPLRIILKKGNDKFYLIHEEGEFALTITEAELIIRKVSLIPSIKESYMKLMDDGNPAQYFLKTPSINYYSIQSGSTQFMRDDLFMGKLPRRIIIGMVRYLFTTPISFFIFYFF